MSIMKDVLNVLMASKGIGVTVDQISTKTGYSAQQCANAAHHLIKRGSLSIERVMNGVYVYNPDGNQNGNARKSKEQGVAPAPESTSSTLLMLEVVATLPEGWSVGIQKGTGKAYRIEPLS